MRLLFGIGSVVKNIVVGGMTEKSKKSNRDKRKTEKKKKIRKESTQ
jgi:hypothetical protein